MLVGRQPPDVPCCDWPAQDGVVNLQPRELQPVSRGFFNQHVDDLTMNRISCQLLVASVVGVVLGWSQTPAVWAAAKPASPTEVAQALTPLLDALAGRKARFQVEGRLELPVNGKPQTITLRLAMYDRHSFDLDVMHADYAVQIRRRQSATAFALPRHRVVFLGRGDTPSRDHLAPLGVTGRLFTARTQASLALAWLMTQPPESSSKYLAGLLGQPKNKSDGLRVGPDGGLLAKFSSWSLNLLLLETPTPAAAVDEWPGYRVTRIPRNELERQLARGLRRTFEVLWPSPLLTKPPQMPRQVANGEVRFIDGQRVVLLHGSPEQIGRAHGQLLGSEATACIDSVLYAFGTAQTIRSGRWFRHDLQAAYARLSPHIPERHKRETRALATALKLDNQLVQALNVFPELFHCSGFAVFGKATRDGKLYHGRVLDYMTTIGLQDAATTFIVHVDGRIPFANVGYAGFIGSVSGMNARGVSLGEMGGKGEGQWDGAPMATLMRRALEEAHTLEDVMRLWEASPRTCEYYYVFADGKTNRAVGVAATPEKIEWILPGQSHPKLGPGIPDAVVLSAGSRLATLRERVQSRYGQIDAELGKWLMSRPVAMKSNLHNVLFVPADRVFYVANASHNQPAAERPYAKLNLVELLESMKKRSVKETAAR